MLKLGTVAEIKRFFMNFAQGFSSIPFSAGRFLTITLKTNPENFWYKEEIVFFVSCSRLTHNCKTKLP
jgi:hypothetical protein